MSTPIRILVAEDLPSDVFLLQRTIANLPGDPPQVMYEETLTGALARLAEQRIDLVLLDLDLLDSSGVDTLVAVRSAAPDIPVVVVSGRTDDETVRACRDAGARQFLAKGVFTADHLRRVLPAAS